MDYRNIVALFSKSLAMDLEAEPPIPPAVEKGSCCNVWTVLGYFDALQIYPLPKQGTSWLSDVLRHNQELSESVDGDYYFHPLHLTTGTSETVDEGKYHDFWTEHEDMPFLFLTLVQEAMPGHIKKIQEAVLSGNGRSNVCRVCYRTMELSDLAVIWRSNSLYDIFEEIHDLYRMEEVGDLSTFSTISREFIDRFGNDDKPKVDEGKEIFVSARYVVRSVEEADLYIAQLKSVGIDTNHLYFCTGMEDLHMLQENISVAGFLQMLYAHLHDNHHKAFFECSTRLGILENPQSSSRTANTGEAAGPGKRTLFQDKRTANQCRGGCYPTSFSENCRHLLTRFQSARKRAAQLATAESAWMKPASNLLNALADMSKNWVMDGFCYLIYDAARLFCEKIDRWSDKHRPMNSREEIEAVQRFVRGWGGLMEQATRIDGRFIQMPGFSPALCEIPAHLLECYLSVMMCCADLMVTRNEQHSIALLLVPKICRRMKVVPILESTQDNSHLLYVDIPMEMLYEPIPVLCCLCHEMAHFLGDEWRKRKNRANLIIYATAYELACKLNLRASPTAISTIYDDLNRVCMYEAKKRSISVEYVENLRFLLKNGVCALLEDHERLLDWNKKYLIDSNLSAEQMRNIQMRSRLGRSDLLYGDNADFFDNIENLIYLLRECYADIVMLYLLKPSEGMYKNFAALEIEIQDKDSKQWRRDTRYYTLVERWGLVIMAAKKKGLWNVVSPENSSFEWKNSPSIAEFYTDVNQFIQWFYETGGKNEYYLSKEPLQQVFDYLSDCYDTINDSLRGSVQNCSEERYKNLFNLWTLFSKMSQQYDVDYELFENFIEQYRKKMHQ